MNAARNYSIIKREQAIKVSKKTTSIYESVELPKGLEDKFNALDRQNWLDEKYTVGYDTLHLHKSNRTFSTNSPLETKDAYSVKAETGLTWKQLDWIFKN